MEDLELQPCKGGCKQLLNKELFGINEKTNKDYKHCIRCRERKSREKEKLIYEEDNTINKEMEDKKKRENRPSISLQKQQIVLKEQDYKCRGPSKNDNNEYECDMNVNRKRFCDKKASEPQFDHIIRWKEGGNGLENIQALCASCHLMKTSMENIMNEDSECSSERVNIILKSLSRPKYQGIDNDNDNDNNDSDSDDEYGNFFRRHK